MLKFIFKYFVELTGNPAASSMLRRFSKSTWSRPLVRPFAKTFRIDETEMAQRLASFDSIHALFTRKLRDGVRRTDERTDTLVSPVDGVINAFGRISDDQTFHIKNQLYNLDEMLGSRESASLYEGGQFAVVYLSPAHYHRIHCHATGRLIKRWALGELSFPVNSLGEKYGQKPFSTNYRIISELETDAGRTALIKVGALNINSICLTNSKSCIHKGEELGYFSFGSTVILLFDEQSRFIPKMSLLQDVKMGEVIGKHGS